MTNPILDTNSSRTTVAGAETIIIDRMPALLSGATMSVSGVATSSAEVVATFDAHRAAMTATDAAKKAYHDAVAAERVLYAKARAAASALQLYVAAVCGATEPDRGGARIFEPGRARSRPRRPSAMPSRKERRRGRRGTRWETRQRAAVKGAASATAPAGRTAVAAAVAPPDGVPAPAAAAVAVEPRRGRRAVTAGSMRASRASR